MQFYEDKTNFDEKFNGNVRFFAKRKRNPNEN